MRKWLLCIMFILMLVAFGSCGKTSVVSERQMQKDFQNTLQSYDSEISISNLEIEKRITDKDNKSDTIYIWCDVETPKFTAHQGFELHYVLYNDGWKYEDYTTYDEGNWTSKPLTPVDENEALSYKKMPSGYDIIDCDTTIDDSDSKNITCTINYNFKQTGDIFIMQKIRTYEYSWNTQYTTWEIINCEDTLVNKTFNEDIVGKWEINTEKSNFKSLSGTLTISKDEYGYYIEEAEVYKDGELRGTTDGIAKDGLYLKEGSSNSEIRINLANPNKFLYGYSISIKNNSIGTGSDHYHEYTDGVFSKVN